MPELPDYTAPCGCYRHTEYNEEGEIAWVDEAMCHTHVRNPWALTPIDMRTYKFTLYPTDEALKDIREQEKEGTGHG